jgi:hypothetical protein
VTLYGKADERFVDRAMTCVLNDACALLASFPKKRPPTEGAELLDTTGGIAGVPSLAQTMVGRN